MLVSLPVSCCVHELERASANCPLVWISPVSQNYEGPRTPYGDAYHGYWIADASQMNSRFGTPDDLKALSTELHRRGMFVANSHDLCLLSHLTFPGT
jgi:maltooligosyltrehalose synthase